MVAHHVVAPERTAPGVEPETRLRQGLELQAAWPATDGSFAGDSIRYPAVMLVVRRVE